MSQTNEQTSEPQLNPQRQSQAKKLSRIKRNLGIIEFTVSAMIILALVFSGFSSTFISNFNLPEIVTAIIYAIILMLVFQIFSLPGGYYREFVLDRKYGLSTQSFKSWVSDELKSTGIGLVLGAAAVAVLYAYISALRGTWWLATWGTTLLFTVIITNLAPLILVPLFFKMRLLDNIELKARLESLSKKAKTKVHGIYLIEFSRKGTTANAALMGLGNTLRIVLSDTLITRYTPEEIEVITAHELGHHVHKDTLRLMAVQSAILLVVFYLGYVIFSSTVTVLGFKGMNDAAALPWLAVVFGFFGLLTMPLISTFTRFVENQADEYALNLTDNPVGFTSAMAKLTDQNLGEAQPGRLIQVLFRDHPSYVQRVKHARDYSSTKQRRDAK